MTKAYCRYHGTEHTAPICQDCGEPKELLGYDGQEPHAWGHIWYCGCTKE